MTTLSNHLQRAHTTQFNEYREADKELKSKVINNRKKISTQYNINQTRITDYSAISTTMKLAVDLAVHNGIAFSAFDDQPMRRLMVLAQKGGNDLTKKIINSTNIKASITELGKQKRNEFEKLMRGKIINLTADLATSSARSFMGL